MTRCTVKSPRTLSRLSIALGALILVSASGCAQQAAAPKAGYAFWPPAPSEPRLQYLTSFSKSTDVQPQKSGMDQLIYGKEPEEVMPVSKPYGVKMHNGCIYVCDLKHASVQVLDLRKQQIRIMGATGGERLLAPSDIDIAPEGTIYVADWRRGNIAVFDQQERRIGTITKSDFDPKGVAVYGNELFACDFKSSSIQVFDRTSGKATRVIGEQGMEDGKFIKPVGVATDEQGNIYVTDVLKCSVQKFSNKGKFLKKIGQMGNNSGQFVRPKQVAVDKDGQIYVVDAGFENVQVFSKDGKVLTFFGANGKHPGAMNLPAGVCIDDTDLALFKKYVHPDFVAQRLVIVTNQFGDNKVAVYALGHLRQGVTVKDISGSRTIVPTGVEDPRLASRRGLPPSSPTTLPTADVQ